MKKQQINKLKSDYELIVNQIVKEFCEKHELFLEFWVSDYVGGTACFGDIYFFNFSDIYYDVVNNLPKGKIIKWLYYNIDLLHSKSKESINLHSYSKGLRLNN